MFTNCTFVHFVQCQKFTITNVLYYNNLLSEKHIIAHQLKTKYNFSP